MYNNQINGNQLFIIKKSIKIKTSLKELSLLYPSVCEFCNGFSYENNKCKFFICERTLKNEAEKKIRNFKKKLMIIKGKRLENE